MSQQLLDDPEIGAALEQVRRERVAERVRRDADRQTGASSPLQLSNLLVTGKRMFLRTLRGVIAEYARDEDEVEEELRELKRVLEHALT